MEPITEEPDSDDSHLSVDQLVELRAELERARTRLARSRRTTRDAARPVALDQTAVGRVSRIDAIQNQSMTRGLQERDHARAAHIEDALRRLDAGTYGRCAGCGQPIPYERLLVFPEAPACAGCGGGS